MYSEKLVACIKIDGKVIRENGDTVYLPYGSDYSIYLRNLHTEKCKISITIDDEDVLNNSSIILDAKENVNLKGFLNDNDVKNSFRFIEKTEQISNHRGDKPEDGLIVITYQFVQKIEFPVKDIHHHHYYRQPYEKTIHPHQPYQPQPFWYSSVGDYTVFDNSLSSITTSCSLEMPVSNQSMLNESGITVKGKEVEQSFDQIEDKFNWGDEKNLHIYLKGDVNNRKIKTTRTIKQKIECQTCGTKSKSNAKFCRSCGTFIKHE